MPILPLSAIAPTPVDWLWPRRLALGHLHVFDGDPGVGKSMLLSDLAARLSTGRPFPDAAASSAPEPASVILLNAEDDASGTTHSRLTAAGADTSRVHVWSPAPAEPLPQLPGRLDPLRDAIAALRPRLVVLDPITAFLDRSVAWNSDPDVRRALRPLADLAAAERCAIVLVRHLSKKSAGQSLYRGLGSIALIAACRLAWLAAPDPNNPAQFLLAVNKNNLSPIPTTLAYSLPPQECPHPAPRNGAEWTHLAPRDDAPLESQPHHPQPITWLGPSSAVAADLVAARPRLLPRWRACRVLADLLRDAPRTSKDVQAAARSHNLPLRTLRRAAKDLNVTFRPLGNAHVGRTVYWLLPGQRIPTSALEPGSLDEWLEQLDEQGIFPSRGDGERGKGSM